MQLSKAALARQTSGLSYGQVHILTEGERDRAESKRESERLRERERQRQRDRGGKINSIHTEHLKFHYNLLLVVTEFYTYKPNEINERLENEI